MDQDDVLMPTVFGTTSMMSSAAMRMMPWIFCFFVRSLSFCIVLTPSSCGGP